MNVTSERGTAARPEEIVLTRLLDAPRALVWQVWTDAAHLPRWFGPRSIAVTNCSIDARPGGIVRITHEARDGSGLVVNVKGVVEEAVEPERLVMLLGFADSAGQPAAHPLFADWPVNARLRTAVTFTERGAKTLLTIRQTVVPADAAALPAVERERRMALEGWGQMLDRLGELLAELGGA